MIESLSVRYRKKRGQALIEFVFIFLIAIMVSVKTVNFVNEFVRDSFGNLAHVLSMNLGVGSCPTECFFSRYHNGYSP